MLDPGGNLFRNPVPAGGAVLNGAGECTGFLSMQEWGLAETPVFLTSTMQVGRVYDAACELLIAEEPAIGTEDVRTTDAQTGRAALVEDFDDGYYALFKELDAKAREELVGGRRHLYEAEMKEDRRTHGARHHEAAPEPGT
jgi:L-aminopeptidase/D-esterase-like protein